MYLYSIRKTLNKIFLTFALILFAYLFTNFVIFERVILPQAENDAITKKYSNAIVLYNIAYTYYSCFHYGEHNKEIYFEIPYKRAMCYLKKNDIKNSIKSMLDGMSAIQFQYGALSKENAYFVRKYLIEYYLYNNKNGLAQREYDNLLLIYKKIGYDDNTVADLIRLCGDIAFQAKQYDRAMTLYRRASDVLTNQNVVDMGIRSRVIDRIAEYEIQNDHTDIAIDLYKSLIMRLESAGDDQNKLLAETRLRLGDAYDKNENTKAAIDCYEKAIENIKKLPKNTYLRQNRKEYFLILKALYDKDGQFSKSRDVDVELARERRFSFF